MKFKLNTLVIKRILAYLPTRLPVGMTEFNKWSNSIIELVGPIADETSLKWALAVAVLHLGETASSKPKMYFVRKLLKGAANQVVSQVIQDIKEAQKAAQDAAKKQQEEQQQAAALANPPAGAAASDLQVANEQQGIQKA